MEKLCPLINSVCVKDRCRLWVPYLQEYCSGYSDFTVDEGYCKFERALEK